MAHSGSQHKMYLFELFDSESIKSQLQQNLIDVLTPLQANKVPFVSVQSIIDNLNSAKTGILIDRALVMDLLDPDKIKSISKIEGDRVYLQVPDDKTVDSSKEQEEDQVDKVKKMAIKKAKSDVEDAKKPVAAKS